MTDKLLQDVDDDARRLAKGLVRSERHAALGVLEPGTGAPAVSRVSLATDLSGAPLFLISRLSPHFGALEADPRASLMVGTPGKGDPLAHPRVMLAGRAAMLDGEARAAARSRFLAKHPKAALYADFGDFAFWRFAIGGVSLNGGFARAFAPTPDDLTAPVPDGLAALEAEAVEHMNADHADAVRDYATILLKKRDAAWRLTGIDAEGLDLAAGDETARLWFDRPLEGAEALRPRLIALAKRARGEG